MNELMHNKFSGYEIISSLETGFLTGGFTESFFQTTPNDLGKEGSNNCFGVNCTSGCGIIDPQNKGCNSVTGCGHKN